MPFVSNNQFPKHLHGEAPAPIGSWCPPFFLFQKSIYTMLGMMLLMMLYMILTMSNYTILYHNSCLLAKNMMKCMMLDTIPHMILGMIQCMIPNTNLIVSLAGLKTRTFVICLLFQIINFLTIYMGRHQPQTGASHFILFQKSIYTILGMMLDMIPHMILYMMQCMIPNTNLIVSLAGLEPGHLSYAFCFKQSIS